MEGAYAVVKGAAGVFVLVWCADCHQFHSPLWAFRPQRIPPIPLPVEWAAP